MISRQPRDRDNDTFCSLAKLVSTQISQYLFAYIFNDRQMTQRSLASHNDSRPLYVRWSVKLRLASEKNRKKLEQRFFCVLKVHSFPFKTSQKLPLYVHCKESYHRSRLRHYRKIYFRHHVA